MNKKLIFVLVFFAALVNAKITHFKMPVDQFDLAFDDVSAQSLGAFLALLLSHMFKAKP